MKVNRQNRRENRASKANDATTNTRKSTRAAKNKQQNLDQIAGDAAFNKESGVDLSTASQRDKTKTDSYIKHNKSNNARSKNYTNI